MKDLDQYIDKLIEEKGFDEKDPEVLEQIKSDLVDRLENRINAMVISSLDEKDLPVFEEVLNTDDKEKIEQFTIEHIPDFKERLASELLTFRNIYLG